MGRTGIQWYRWNTEISDEGDCFQVTNDVPTPRRRLRDALIVIGLYVAGAALLLAFFLWALADRHLVTLDWKQGYSVVLYENSSIDSDAVFVKYEVTKNGEAVLPRRSLGHYGYSTDRRFRLIEAGETGVVALIVISEAGPNVVMELFDFAHPAAINPPAADAVEKFWKAIPKTRLFVPRDDPGDHTGIWR